MDEKYDGKVFIARMVENIALWGWSGGHNMKRLQNSGTFYGNKLFRKII